MRKVVILLLVLATLIGGGVAIWRQWTRQMLRQGEDALAAHAYEEAQGHLARYLYWRPGDAHARLLAARTARRLLSYDEAAEHLRRCRQDGGDEEAIAVEGALAEVQRGAHGPVDSLRQRAGGDDELALVILEVLIQYDIDTYRLRHAQHGLNRYLERRPDDLQARLGRGFVWERLLSFADALEDYRHAVQAHPTSELARQRLADTLLIVGNPGE